MISAAASDADEAKKIANPNGTGRKKLTAIFEDPDLDREEKEKRAKEAARLGWRYKSHHRQQEGAVDEISFRAFVSVYNEMMGQARRRVRLDIKTMFERMVHDTRGVSKE